MRCHRGHHLGMRCCLAVVWLRLMGIILLLLLASRNTLALSLSPNNIGGPTGKDTKPILCSVTSKIIGIGTRLALCARKVQDLSVQVEAPSNRALLRGDLDRIAINLNNGRGPLLGSINQLKIDATNLHLGWWPLMWTSLPAIWYLFRPPLFFMLYMYFCSSLFVPTEYKAQLQSRFRNFMGGSPCSLRYQLIISENDVAHSNLFQFILRSMLRSLMLNSVLGVAAATADAMNQQQQLSNSNLRQQQSPYGTASRGQQPLILKAAAIPDSLVEENKRNTRKQNNNNPPPAVLTKLLEATSFELKKTTFTDWYVVMDADAVLPESNGQTRLSYTLRTTPQGLRLQQQQKDQTNTKKSTNALALTSPECQFSLSAAVGGGSFLERFLPDVWLPVGPGVALPLGSRHSIRKIIASRGTCRIHGQIDIMKDDDKSITKGIIRRIQNVLPPSWNQDQSSPKKRF